MTKDDLKDQVHAAIERHADEIITIGEQIRRTPELGFKEFKTAKLVEETLGKIGLSPKGGLAITGVRADLPGRAGDGPTFAMLGELDALVVAGHPEADATTGAAHACGHNAQVAGLLGAAMGLIDAKAAQHLAGRLVFFAVPAEEYGDVEWRVSQARAGKLEFLGGKPELLRLGHFDDVDLSMMIHGTSRPEDGKAGVGVSNNGCIVKTVRYLGKAAHAGGAPHMGINALYAAQIGLMAINAIRETFRDEDTIRVHPIITHGGSQVNVIPGEVRLETYVRGRTVEAIMAANARVDRALRAGALALGAKVEIETLPGYMPMQCDATMARDVQGDDGAHGGRGALPGDRPPHRLDRHGRPEPGDADPAPVHRRRAGHRARRGLRDRRQAPDVPGPREGARVDGDRSPVRRRRRREAGVEGGQAADDPRAVPDVPALGREARGVRGLILCMARRRSIFRGAWSA